jgi:rhomboid-like protein
MLCIRFHLASWAISVILLLLSSPPVCYAINRPSSHVIETNPNYRGNFNRPITLGDLEKDRYISRPTDGDDSSLVSFQNSNQRYSNASTSPQSITSIIQEFFANLHRLSPTLHYGTLVSLGLFCAWQIPALSQILQNHFICSRANVLYRKRFHAVFLSTVSHASFRHLAMNLYGWVTFGTSVTRVLQRNRLDLRFFVLGAAIVSSAAFLVLSKHGGCIGLSGVTLALLAFDARVFPNRQLGMVIGFLPIRMAAEHILIVISLMSVLGIVSQGRSPGPNVAHATHLGGIIFGIVYYEMMRRGWLTVHRPALFRLNIWRSKMPF